MASAELKWATEQRFQFVEYQAFWRGSLNRIDLTSQFGISVPQASKDLSAYQEMFPENIQYDHRQKRYFATKDFKPHFISVDADVFLSGLIAGDHEPAQYNEIVGEAVPVPARRVDPYVLQAIVECISNNQSITVLYQSMNPNRPEPQWRRITPHSFMSDGLRWHARAYCHIDSKFKDFLLSRCIKSGDFADPGLRVEDDLFWNKTFNVVLIPNPALSESQQKVIATDYAMIDGEVRIPVRMAALYYFEKRLRLDIAHLVDQPGECPVVISNRAEFELARRGATK
ncbi:MAG: transcriptional regulator [Hoeflea sp.]|uniref:WYL domain-containing protein n=1 Tax=Hoeflea sp. TaxID=1940281 RepID=UPI000C0D0454|nr:WYL domain-containing protein [Hoeflea sp.]PHR22452.1 MAG: transcriptional regulator [Hoeflea sp.]